jgi:hypothetical protein
MKDCEKIVTSCFFLGLFVERLISVGRWSLSSIAFACYGCPKERVS